MADFSQHFLDPKCAAQRQYEALRAYFVEGISSREAASRFGYTHGSFRVLCHEFRKCPEKQFFVDVVKGIHTDTPGEQPEHYDTILMLRKQNFSVYDISRSLREAGIKMSPAAISIFLKEKGFSKLPRRARDNRLNSAETTPDIAPTADFRSGVPLGNFDTKFGGLFLLLPYLIKVPFDKLVNESGFPGTDRIPASYAIRALLSLKLFGSARMGHVMSYVFDQGLALFAGLNAIPKRSYLAEYSCRVNPKSVKKMMETWFCEMTTKGLTVGSSFDVDFHTIPFHGDDPLVEKHYVSKRSRKERGNLAFLVWDSENTHFCFSNAEIKKSEQADEILKFAEYWKNRSNGDGNYPKELIFDSTLTTHRNLNELNKRGIFFITLRRRSPGVMKPIEKMSSASWKRITLENVSRQFRNPSVIDQTITLDGFKGEIRQIAIKDLGHEKPTLLLTNQMKLTPSKLVGRYARRMIIENGIADAIDFFHMDSLTSAISLRVNFDLLLTLMGGSIYRLFAEDIGGVYRTAKFQHIFRDFIDAVANITVTEKLIKVKFQRRSHNPLLMSSGLLDDTPIIPWLGKKLIFTIR